MSTIVTRAGKGSPLTHNEVDANFNNLNNDKYQSGDSPTFVTVNATTVDATNLEVTNVKAKDGTAALSIADSTGKVTVSTELAVDNINVSGNAITSTNSNGNIDLTPNGTGEVNITKVDIDSGAIDGTTIGGSSAAAGTFTSLTNSGNLTFSSTGQRITGDMSNATHSNRLLFQTSTANSTTVVGVIPNGTGIAGQINLYSKSDPANASIGQFLVLDTADTRLVSGITGTGTYLPMTFYTGGSERMRLDTSGSMLLGTTSAISTSTAKFQLAGSGVTAALTLARTDAPTSGASFVGIDAWANDGSAYVVGGTINFRAAENWTSTNHGTDIQFRATASGSGGALFEAMRITSAGNVGIGTASTGFNAAGLPLVVGSGSGNTGMTIFSGTAGVGSIHFGDTVTTGADGYRGFLNYNHSTNAMQLGTDATARMTIDSSGNVGIGKTPTSGRLLDVNADSWLNNVRVGRGSGNDSNSTAVGNGALSSTTSGTVNTAVGAGALAANTTASGNNAFGRHALTANTTGYGNVAIGSNDVATTPTMASNTTGYYNVAVGNGALSANTTGYINTAVGRNALLSNTTGVINSAFGHSALLSNTTGSYSTAVGASALQTNTTGYYNTAVGYASQYAGTTAFINTSIGMYSLSQVTTGYGNLAGGYYAGYGLTTGAYNVFLGNQAGYQYVPGGMTTGTGNICLGAYSDGATATDSYTIVIGYATQGKGTSTGFINPYNGGNMYQGNNTTTWTTTSDRRIKKNIVDNNEGLEKIKQLRVRNFEYRKKEELDPELPESAAIDVSGVQLGVIAQEIREVLPECVKEESTGVLSVNSDRLIWHLVNAVKDLSAQVDALKAKLGE